MTPCERIDQILSEIKMSRRQLALKAGIAPSTLQSAMQRNKGLSLEILFKISEVLGYDVEFLQTGESRKSYIEYLSGDELDEEYKRTMRRMFSELSEDSVKKVYQYIEDLHSLEFFKATIMKEGNGK